MNKLLCHVWSMWERKLFTCTWSDHVWKTINERERERGRERKKEREDSWSCNSVSAYTRRWCTAIHALLLGHTSLQVGNGQIKNKGIKIWKSRIVMIILLNPIKMYKKRHCGATANQVGNANFGTANEMIARRSMAYKHKTKIFWMVSESACFSLKQRK